MICAGAVPVVDRLILAVAQGAAPMAWYSTYVLYMQDY